MTLLTNSSLCTHENLIRHDSIAVINTTFSHHISLPELTEQNEAIWKLSPAVRQNFRTQPRMLWSRENVSIYSQLPPSEHMFQRLKVPVNKFLFADQHKFHSQNTELKNFLFHISFDEKQFSLFPRAESRLPSPTKTKNSDNFFTFVWWIIHRLTRPSTRAWFCHRDFFFFLFVF